MTQICSIDCLPFAYLLVDFFIFVTSSNNRWMLRIEICKTVVLVKLHSLFWSLARSLTALLNMVDEIKIKVVPTVNVLIIKS